MYYLVRNCYNINFLHATLLLSKIETKKLKITVYKRFIRQFFGDSLVPRLLLVEAELILVYIPQPAR